MDSTAGDVLGRKLRVIVANTLPHVLNTLLAIVVLCATDLSTYPSATVDDFQPPCFLESSSSPQNQQKLEQIVFEIYACMIMMILCCC